MELLRISDSCHSVVDRSILTTVLFNKKMGVQL